MPAVVALLAAAALVPAALVAAWPLLARRLLSNRPTALEPARAASLSVLIPVCGDEPGLAAGISAALGQSWPGHDFEVLIVMADATDGALPVAREAIAAAPSRGRTLVAAARAGEPGKAQQLAAGIEASRGEWLVLLDSDARLPDPQWLRRFCAPLCEAGTGLVSCLPVHRAPRSAAAVALAATIEPDLLGCFGMLDAVGHLDVANGSCLAIRRDTLRRVHGADAMRGRLLMDAALARAVRAGGGTVRVHGEPLPLEAHAIRWRAVREQSHRWLAAILRGLPLPVAAGFVWLRCGTLLALLLAVLGDGIWRWLGVAAMAVRAIAALTLRAALGVPPTPRSVTLQLAVDLAAGVTWIVAIVDSRVTWRGRKWRVRRNALVEPLAPGGSRRHSGS